MGNIQIRCSYDRLVPVSELKSKFNKLNANAHPPEQIDELVEQFRWQGVRHPAIVSKRTGLVVAGHGRILAAEDAGMKEYPVSDQDFESEAQEYSFLIADNEVHRWSTVDLKKIHTALPNIEPFDISRLAIRDFKFEPDPPQGDADTLPDVPKVAKTKRGELWTLGAHRLLIDDCTVKENVGRLMAGERADMVFTDPPYNHAGKDDLVASPVSQAMQRLKDSEWDKNFDASAMLSRIDEAVAPDCSIYICTSWHLAGAIWEFYSTRSTHSSYCVWSKPNPMPSLMKRHWTWASELICYATRGKHAFNFPAEGHARNVWEIQKSQKNDLHPTMKPIEVVERAVSHSSNPGQAVLDLFLGSGSTLIACEKTGRRCFGMEIEPLYGDVILDRFEKYTGKTPVREDGKTWDEVKNGT